MIGKGLVIWLGALLLSGGVMAAAEETARDRAPVEARSAGDSAPAETEQTENQSPAERAPAGVGELESRAESDDSPFDYRASEQISEDKSVSFPVDI